MGNNRTLLKLLSIRSILIILATICLFVSTANAFTDNSNSTVTDEKTGLIWQKEDNDKTYNWYEASGIQDATFNPAGENICGHITLGGYSDWRLPSKDDLLSIVDDAVPEPGPKIDTAHFPNTKSSVYWSSTSGEGNPGAGFGVVFRSGNLFIGHKGTNRWYIRCVRGGADTPSVISESSKTCPKTRYVNCMPPITEKSRPLCSRDNLQWIKQNCPDIKVTH